MSFLVAPVIRPARIASPIALTMKLSEAWLEDSFKNFDLDGNGFLNEAELKSAFEAAGEPTDDKTLRRSFMMIDTNHDGKISLDEFKAIANQNEMPDFMSWLGETAARDAGHVFEDVPEDSWLAQKDALLAQKDTRRFCLDRCLATGYCDALEDFLQMSTVQVRKFCESCSQDDECQLDNA
uniref:EF-hand domain-containing protein n=1 Tax=Prymnesium polylepis TaxID=72548 RepID=A0A7S4JUT6_9EUKA|eukprot:2984113-Prymnesium_polylepis.1